MRKAVTSEFDRMSVTPPRAAEWREVAHEPSPARLPRALTRVAGAVGWALAGFMVGAVFWHFVGFWSFLSSVVLKGPEPRPRLERYVFVETRASTPQPERPADVRTEALAEPARASVSASVPPVPVAGCIVLERGAAAGDARAFPCPAGSLDPPVTMAGLAVKTDREAEVAAAASVGTWSATVASPSPGPIPPLSPVKSALDR